MTNVMKATTIEIVNNGTKEKVTKLVGQGDGGAFIGINYSPKKECDGGK